MYTINSGQFSTQMILIYYYGMVLLNILVNSFFSLLDKKEDRFSLRKFIGDALNNILLNKLKIKIYFQGILLNSLSSVLSFNNFDFYLLLGKVEKKEIKERMHQSTFCKQIVYNIIILAVNIG